MSGLAYNRNQHTRKRMTLNTDHSAASDSSPDQVVVRTMSPPFWYQQTNRHY